VVPAALTNDARLDVPSAAVCTAVSVRADPRPFTGVVYVI